MTQLLDRSKHLILQTPLACSEIWWCHDTVVGPLKAPYTSTPPPSLVVKYGDVMHSCWTAQSTLHFKPPSLVVKYGDVMTQLLDRSKHLTLQPPPSLVVKYGDVMTRLLDRSKHLTLHTCHDTVVGPLKAPYTSTPSLVVKYGDVMTRLLDRSKHLTLQPPLACSQIWWCHDTVTRWTAQSTLHFKPPSLVVKYGGVMTQLLDRSKHLTLQTPLACSEIWWCHDTVVGPLKAPYTSTPPSLVVKYGDVMTQLLDRSKHLTLQPPSLVVKYGDVMTRLLDRSKHLTLQPPPRL